jgi:hypothetical protein
MGFQNIWHAPIIMIGDRFIIANMPKNGKREEYLP